MLGDTSVEGTGGATHIPSVAAWAGIIINDRRAQGERNLIFKFEERIYFECILMDYLKVYLRVEFCKLFE